MRRPGSSLGTKVALAVAAAATCVASAVGVLVHRLTAEDQLKTARAAFDRDMVTAAYDHAAGRRNQARVDRPGLPAPVVHAVRNKVRVTYLHDGVLWAATPVAGGKVLSLRRSYRPEEEALSTLDRTLLATGAAATVAVSLAGLLLGMRMGRRATAAARTAERIAEGDLDARVHPRGHDEIARLAAAVNTMADALGARLEAERRVTADIAHELRTPVAGMSTAVGLLPPGRPSELIADSVGRLRGLVEDVLEVARMDAQVAAVEKEQREVSAMARRAVAGLAGVTVEIVTDAAVATDPRRVERILTNLAANALRHGRAPVLVTVEGAVIRVRDRGDGFPADLLAILHASGPQRFRTGGRTGGTA
ncbi:sensor histidine kinase [Streptomyces acidiscabies]|uniref:sensor histidine kinase n=1 Tax=Streptomyces acidiscabies TaxID=42234 RepID=UPI00095B66E0|nr:HAMP domain-containing sensor histidine kinase [Streptomyces acidiscabies]GAV39917.1 sensor protein CseC [Streptomyces acidiscabies]